MGLEAVALLARVAAEIAARSQIVCLLRLPPFGTGEKVVEQVSPPHAFRKIPKSKFQSFGFKFKVSKLKVSNFKLNPNLYFDFGGYEFVLVVVTLPMGYSRPGACA